MSPSHEDREARTELLEQARRLTALVLFRRLKAMVEAWEREERGKARVALGALIGLAALAGATALVALWWPGYWGQTLLLGFVVWIGAVLMLMRAHLRGGH